MIDKNFEDFAFKNKAENILHAWCKSCHKEYKDEHYATNKKDYIVRVGQYKKRKKIEIYKALEEYVKKFPCVDCGERDYIVLQFDHVRGTKTAGISEMISSGWPWEKILKELEKCQVRCANCHVRRTAVQFGWYKSCPHEHT